MRSRITKLLSYLLFLCILSGCQNIVTICEEPADNTYKYYNNFYISGAELRSTIDNLDSACIVVINPKKPDGEYAMVCNLSLWAGDSMNNTEYANWITKEEFDSILAYDEESCYYLTETLPYANISYGIKYDIVDTCEEIKCTHRYIARLIKLPTGEILGIVLEHYSDSTDE